MHIRAFHKAPLHKAKGCFIRSLNESADDTRTLDTLNKEFLSEKIYDKQRGNNYESACITYSCFVRRLRDEILNIQGFRNCNDIGEELRSGACKEQSGVEAVRPLP